MVTASFKMLQVSDRIATPIGHVGIHDWASTNPLAGIMGVGGGTSEVQVLWLTRIDGVISFHAALQDATIWRSHFARDQSWIN